MLLDLLVIVAVVVLMIAVNALYVGAEFATVGARKTRIRQMAGSGNQSAEKLLPILDEGHQIDDYVAACQLGITLSSLVLAAYGERQVAPLLNDTPFFQWLAQRGFSAETTASLFILILFTILQVIFGELLPKSIAVQYPESLALKLVSVVNFSRTLFRPLIWLFNGSARFILRLLGYNSVKEGISAIYSPEEIEILVEESQVGGVLEKEERKLLRNAFRLSDLTARQVMVHRTKMVMADINISVSDLLALCIAEGFSRIPLYENDEDNIVGFVHIKDVFRLHLLGEKDVRPILREIVFVPEALSAVDVWEKLNSQAKYVAVVFDEYGGVAGILTQEDLIEEIFGDVRDEFDSAEAAPASRSEDGHFTLRADLLVTDVNEYLDVSLPEDVADTIGGFVFSELGRRAHVGDEVLVDDLRIRVEEIEDSRIQTVSIITPQPLELAEVSDWATQTDVGTEAGLEEKQETPQRKEATNDDLL